MTLQQNNDDYQIFLKTLEDGGWIGFQTYSFFYRENLLKQQRLAAAIDSEKINFQIISEYHRYSLNELTDGHLTESSFGKIYKKGDHERREIILKYLYHPPHCCNYMHFMLDANSFLSWLNKEYPYEGEAQAEHTETAKETISELCLADILKLITPEMYPDGLKSQGKSAITNSLKTLQGQIPKAFELCSALVMEAMPCESRKEPLKYSRDDIITRAKEKGINKPTALQIYQGLPVMLKKMLKK